MWLSRFRSWRRFIPAQAGNTSVGSILAGVVPVHPRAGGEHRLTLQVHKLAQRFIPAQAGNTLLLLLPRPVVPVHPRAGGEHRRRPTTKPPASGSSPRRRGTRHSLTSRHHRRRFIPAQAGNTRRPARAPSRSTVHPRAGGEHATTRRSSRFSSGSSPRRRGTQVCQRLPGHRHRFIPAQAGNTSFYAFCRVSKPVHPRAGGEHSAHAGAIRRDTGSSPRRRGTPEIVFDGRCNLRFIPAQAGNTLRKSATKGFASVHPRAGGEHSVAVKPVVESYGSSPRRRGTRITRTQPVLTGRFIPAQAGNTAALRGRRRRVPVHPRAGGEHTHGRESREGYGGSSPRRRGTRDISAVFHPWISVHPRAGGEHTTKTSTTKTKAGSSPRRRGTRKRFGRTRHSRRFIPAQAGNTSP